MTSTTTITRTVPAKSGNKLPSTICDGYTDIHGRWHNDFPCPIENFIQYFCCGTDAYRYCCSADQYSFQTKSHVDFQHYSPTSANEKLQTALNNHKKMITKQFEQFQRYFLPSFLLTTTILFLVGIALWFWLYKHKTFYSLTADDIPQVPNEIDSMTTRKRDSINLTTDHPSRRLSHPSTDV